MRSTIIDTVAQKATQYPYLIEFRVKVGSGYRYEIYMIISKNKGHMLGSDDGIDFKFNVDITESSCNFYCIPFIVYNYPSNLYNILINDGVVFVVNNNREGIVLHSTNSDYEVGHYSNSWCIEDAMSFTKDILLKNDRERHG